MYFFFLSSLSFIPLTSLFYCTVIPWLLPLHEKGGSVLPLLLKARVIQQGQHKVRYKRLQITQPSYYGTLDTPLACSFLRCPMAKLFILPIPGCFLVSLGLLVLPRFQIQGRFWIFRLDGDPARQFPSSSTFSWGRLLVGLVGWIGSFLMMSLLVACSAQDPEISSNF